MGQAFSTDLAMIGLSLIGSLMRLLSGCRLKLHSFEGLTKAGGAVSKVAHWNGCGFGGSCWQKALIPPLMGFSTGCFGCPQNMAPGFFYCEWSKREKGESDRSYHFYGLALEVTKHHITTFAKSDLHSRRVEFRFTSLSEMYQRICGHIREQNMFLTRRGKLISCHHCTSFDTNSDK